jgi:aprataxin
MSSPPQLKILRTYAKLDDVSLTKLLPPTVYFSHTRYTLTIFDAYPKALFHFLILPRLRVVVAPVTAATATSSEDLDEAGGGDDDTGAGELTTASATDLTDLRTLLLRATTTTTTTTRDSNNNNNNDARTAIGFSTLRVLAEEAARVRREIEREMETRYGCVWDIWIGFHAVPSME